MLSLTNPELGVDLSNYTGTLEPDEIGRLISAGKRFAVVRLSTEDGYRRQLARQQCGALQDAGIATLGYAWCYWSMDPVEAMYDYAALAQECRVPVVALDMEDAPGTVGVAGWVVQAVVALRDHRIIPVLTTYPAWEHGMAASLAVLGNIRWWVALYNGRADLDVPSPYPAARVVAHQYADTSDVTELVLDSDVWQFDAEIVAALENAQGGIDMDEATVRRIVREELDSVARALGQDEGFAAMEEAVLRRIAAAGKALDLFSPVPPAPSAGG